MTTYTILHNPRCSKSRATLQLLLENNIQPTVIEYLKTPITTEELNLILKKLNRSARDCMRKNEPLFKEKCLNNPDITEEELVEHMSNHPILIERPIVYTENHAIIGRPPSNVLTLLS
jgi:arsenate reductase (glutaredoxin)